MVRAGTSSLLLIAAGLAAGCASGPGEQLPSLVTEQAPSAPAPAATAYVLSPQELGYSCKKLIGVMQVRLLQVRNYDPAQNASGIARGVHSVATPILGGTTTGIDPAGQHQRDLAMLEAYNRQLAAKNCKTFDLAAELKKTDPLDTPQPTMPAKAP